MIIIALESSCDETAASVCKDGKILSSIIRSQEIHNTYGGVVPEVASREHDSHINYIVHKALDKANCTFHDIDAIAVTYGAGLLGSLLVGLNYAKGLSIGLKIPFIGVNHLEGHLYANFISFPNLEYPYICLLVTGGHTQIWEVQSPGKYLLHSTTVDDAAGEAFDKGARILGLSYPGGPEIEKIAKDGDVASFPFTIPKLKNNSLNFSFSGLKTAILYKVQEIPKENLSVNIPNLAASYQEVIVDTLLNKLNKVINKTGIYNVSITGGVAANKRFRSKANLLADQKKIKLYFPETKYCTDNAAMIAIAGYQYLKEGKKSSLSLEANPSLSLDESDYV